MDIEDAKEKDFIVSVITDGTPASGYEVGNMQVVKGESIKITGPESSIDIIDKVIATVSVVGKTADETVPAFFRSLTGTGNHSRKAR